MNLDQLKSAYERADLDKAGYIEQMYEHHQVLFDYARHIEGTDVESLRIDPAGLTVKFRWPPIELRVPGNEMRAAPVEALNFGAYEKQEFAVVERLIAGLPSPQPVLVDIGGNVGFYSIGLKALHPQLRIHAFEPVPATAEQFEMNCALNGCSDIQLHRHGLSDQSGEVTFFVHRRMSVAASQQNILGGDEMEEVQCRLVRLDDIRDDLGGPVDFIKCDVEGAELSVFRGATQLLKRDKPVVFSEMLRKWSAKFNYHPNDIINLLKGLGYKCHGLGESGVQVVEEVTDSTLETNFIFLHTSHHEGLRLHS